MIDAWTTLVVRCIEYLLVGTRFRLWYDKKGVEAQRFARDRTETLTARERTQNLTFFDELINYL